MRFNSITHAGGVNSIENFARSLTRASAFHEITPRRPSFILAEDSTEEGDGEDLEYGGVQTDYGRIPRSSLIREQLRRSTSDNTVDDESALGDETESSLSRVASHRKSEGERVAGGDHASVQGSVRGNQSIFAIAPHLSTPLAGSYGTSYGTLRSTLNESSMIHAGQLWRQQQATGANVADEEHLPLIVKEVEEDGKIVLVVEGQSTLPQTILNSTNVLIGWLTLPLSFGLMMSPWGGHSVFPNIYRDMRHPYKFDKAVKYTFSFTYVLDATTALAGILMFGDNVMDEVTANIIGNSSYPRSLSLMICIFIAIIPLTKVPLNARPIVSTIELLCGLDSRAMAESSALTGLSGYTRGIMKIAVRIIVLIVFVIIAILFPAFDSIMAFMGSALCFSICVILPLLFYVKIFGKEITRRELILDYCLIVISSIMAIVGTVWAFLPKDLIHAE
ncbi:hypothetical protein SS1G_00020 [Sclerotinia sclerotiorum 1980 UF-70]|uniref:Amino acid transporter transmembrane domain-containing protein n=1 Tax=Sclerotinia sclerotiorum (strain ATCC 18683 / 1980 / Ss-1) TaxID=665079 RepID=A7E3Z8_SCLS1|nr:hypothetical protein SS1G_00020 [Sclerotinia sclerotiorum 1980 UF-70]EDN90620.1 hypothetical protein SS1G_00020 [Sclerotinia sclerotiorum 1980 UF-70]